MKIGLIARSEDRGLGNLTWEWAEHMKPDRILVIEPNHDTPQRLSRYPSSAMWLRWDHHRDSTLPEKRVRGWLDGLDVVYSAETFYDWRICDWAREQGVRTVCHVMPEYFRHGDRLPPPAPDAWWTPTEWRRARLPDSTRLVPVPIATERFQAPSWRSPGPVRWLHAAGTRAAADRNGTRLVLAALRYLKEPHSVRIRTQGEIMRRPTTGRQVQFEQINRSAPEYWHLYADCDALVLPRRYAGLSLPVLEAFGAGLAVMMPDVEPQRSEWPIIPVPAMLRGYVRTAAGAIRLAEVKPETLASAMDAVAIDRTLLFDARDRARTFAASQSWANLEPVIRAELELVVDS